MLEDPIASEIERFIGRSLRMQVGKQVYIGRVVGVTDGIVELVSGDNPMAICLRTDAIDSIMAYASEMEGDKWK